MVALKAVVIFMGVLILAGIAVVAFTIVGGAGGDRADGGGGKAGGFGAIRLEGVAGCRIVESATDDGRLVLRTEGQGPGCGRVHVLDLETGKTLGTIEAGGAD